MVNATLADCPPLVPVTEKLNGFALDCDSPLTVTILLWPAVMLVGLKEQVAPEVHARVIFPANEAEEDALTVNVVDRVPMASDVDLALAESE